MILGQQSRLLWGGNSSDSDSDMESDFLGWREVAQWNCTVVFKTLWFALRFYAFNLIYCPTNPSSAQTSLLPQGLMVPNLSSAPFFFFPPEHSLLSNILHIFWLLMCFHYHFLSYHEVSPYVRDLRLVCRHTCQVSRALLGVQ